MNPFETPQEMVRQLSGMPLTILLAMFVAERLPMSESQLAVAVDRGRNMVGRHLRGLKERGLVFRVRHFGGWDLTPSARQLPFPFLLNSATPKINGRSSEPLLSPDSLHRNSAMMVQNGAIEQVIHRENEDIQGKSGSLHQNSAMMHQNSAMMHQNSAMNSPLIRQTDRQIDINNNIESVNKSSPHPVSISMLRQSGISGDLGTMAWVMPSELIGAWWMCQWGDRPRAVLAKHLIDHRPIDPLYVSLAEWRMVCGETAVNELIELIRADKRPLKRELPEGMTLPMYDVAAKVHEDMGDLPLWISLWN